MTITAPSSDADFDQVYQLNYKTFVDEIPQHRVNADRKLVDKFHEHNHYLIAKNGEQVIAMISYSLQRPFSLDKKMANLDDYLPVYNKLAEIRLLAVAKPERKKMLTYILLKELAVRLIGLGVDTAVISGTTRELSFYNKIGFISFGSVVGSEEAAYQPMYITLNTLRNDFKGN